MFGFGVLRDSIHGNMCFASSLIIYCVNISACNFLTFPHGLRVDNGLLLYYISLSPAALSAKICH